MDTIRYSYWKLVFALIKVKTIRLFYLFFRFDNLHWNVLNSISKRMSNQPVAPTTFVAKIVADTILIRSYAIA